MLIVFGEEMGGGDRRLFSLSLTSSKNKGDYHFPKKVKKSPLL